MITSLDMAIGDFPLLTVQSSLVYNITSIPPYQNITSPTYRDYTNLYFTGVDDCNKIRQLQGVEGRILYLSADTVFCAWEQRVLAAISVGALAVVSWVEYPVPGYYTAIDLTDSSLLTIPLTQIGLPNKHKLDNLISTFQNQPVGSVYLYVQLRSGDTNQWHAAFHSLPFTALFRGVLAGLCSLCAFLALHRLGRWDQIRQQNGTVSYIAVVSLFIELFVNILRAVYLAIDPASSELVFDVVTQSVLFSLCMSLGSLTTTLTALFFMESIHQHSIMSTYFLQSKKTRIIFITTSVFILIIHLIATLTYANNWIHAGIAVMIALPIILVCIIEFCVGTFLLVMSYRVLKHLSAALNYVNQHMAEMYRIRIRSLATRVATSVILIFISSINLLAFGIPMIRQTLTPVSVIIIYWLIFSGLILSSLAQIMLFGIPTQKSREQNSRQENNAFQGRDAVGSPRSASTTPNISGSPMTKRTSKPIPASKSRDPSLVHVHPYRNSMTTQPLRITQEITDISLDASASPSPAPVRPAAITNRVPRTPSMSATTLDVGSEIQLLPTSPVLLPELTPATSRSTAPDAYINRRQVVEQECIQGMVELMPVP